MTKHPYAWICNNCDHPSAWHRLMPEASVEGPYACERCDCQMRQSDPQRDVSKETYVRMFGGGL